MSGKLAIHSTVAAGLSDTPVSTQGGDDADVRHNKMINSLHSEKVMFGIILLIMVLFSVLLVLIYLVRRRVRRGKLPVDLAFPTGDPPELTKGSHGSGNILLHGKAGEASTDIPRLLTFIPTDVYVDGKTETVSPVALADENGPNQILTSYTTFNGRLNPFSCQFSDFVANEGGEVLSPDSDVSVTVQKNSIPAGRIQQMFVNVCHKPNMVTTEMDWLDNVESSPLVEVLAPGLRTLQVPIILRIPLPPGGVKNGITLFWTQSIQIDKISWMVIPKERQDRHVKQLMSYTLDEKFVNVKTHCIEAFSCIATIDSSYL